MRGHAISLNTPRLPFTGASDSTRIASQLAAERAGKSAQTARGKVYACIHAAGPSGATDNEVAAYLPMSPSTVRPRRIELLRAGLIRDADYKRLGCTVWRTT